MLATITTKTKTTYIDIRTIDSISIEVEERSHSQGNVRIVIMVGDNHHSKDYWFKTMAEAEAKQSELNDKVRSVMWSKVLKCLSADDEVHF